MKMNIVCTLALATLIGLTSSVSSHAQETSSAASTAKSVPPNRLEMLEALDKLKHRQARLPLPPAAPESSTGDVRSNAPTARSSGFRSMGVVNNGRMRSLYLPQELQTGGGRFPAASDQGLPYDFSTELFWIVSRVNNCHYCLGHQEHKLQAVGVTEETLLALDTDWSAFPEKEQAAFAFTRQLTLAPHSITDRDIDALREHFSEAEILDIAFIVGRYNATNRWTDSLGIPQEEQRDFVSKLDPKAGSVPSRVAPEGFPARAEKGDFNSWLTAFETQAARQPRLAIVSQLLVDGEPAHEQLLAAIPAAGPTYVEHLRQARIAGELAPGLRDRIAYVVAREDQAWYMQHVSRQRLLSEGLSDEEIFQLSSERSPLDAEGAALQFAIQLTSQPQSMTDEDIQELSQFYTPQQIAEIVYHTGLAALLDRVTEVAQLGW